MASLESFERSMSMATFGVPRRPDAFIGGDICQPMSVVDSLFPRRLSMERKHLMGSLGFVSKTLSPALTRILFSSLIGIRSLTVPIATRSMSFM